MKKVGRFTVENKPNLPLVSSPLVKPNSNIKKILSSKKRNTSRNNLRKKVTTKTLKNKKIVYSPKIIENKNEMKSLTILDINIDVKKTFDQVIYKIYSPYSIYGENRDHKIEIEFPVDNDEYINDIVDSQDFEKAFDIKLSQKVFDKLKKVLKLMHKILEKKSVPFLIKKKGKFISYISQDFRDKSGKDEHNLKELIQEGGNRKSFSKRNRKKKSKKVSIDKLIISV